MNVVVDDVDVDDVDAVQLVDLNGLLAQLVANQSQIRTKHQQQANMSPILCISLVCC